MLSWLFDNSDFMPHGYCLVWYPEILWLHVISDAFIALSYLIIPAVLVYLVLVKKPVMFRNMVLLFAGFIVACGITHIMDILTIWYGSYRLEGVIKLTTAIISTITAILLIPLLPKMLALRSPDELEALNRELELEIAERKQMQIDLLESQTSLSRRIKERTEELTTANQKLEQVIVQHQNSNRDLQHFAYIASHDLQEPARMITGYLQLLSRRYGQKLDEDAKEIIGFAVDGAKRMHELLNALLQYSRLDSQDQGLETVDMEAVLKDVQNDLSRSIADNDAEITHDELPEIPANRVHMRQLLQNLITNAIKFHKPDLKPVIHLAVQERADDWLFSVKDNGIGMDPAFKERIFKMFQRLHTREEYSGIGLGLAICARIVERRGGEIWVDTQPGQGSVFHFTIPKKAQNGDVFEA